MCLVHRLSPLSSPSVLATFSIVCASFTVTLLSLLPSLSRFYSPVARRSSIVKGRKVVQGNFDPCALYSPPERTRENVRRMLDGFGSHPVVVNLGHGMHPTHTPEQLCAFLTAVDSESRAVTAGASA